MKLLTQALLVLSLVSSAFASAETIVEPLERNEIEMAIRIFDRLGVAAIRVNADCLESEAVIESRTKGFNPAQWTATYNDGATYRGGSVSMTEAFLETPEIGAMIDLFNRVGVPAVKVDSITLLSTARIKSRVCGMRPAKWIVKFEE